MPIQNASDGREAFDAKGNFMFFGTVGLRRFMVEQFVQTVGVWERLLVGHPGAVDTMSNFQWDSRKPRHPGFESANSLGDLWLWQYLGLHE